MTVDSILSLLLTVIIPAILAIAGAFLTIRSLNADRIERWSWLSFFVLFAIAAVVLGFWQQVRLTASQTAKEIVASTSQEHLMETQKYTQGQLDSISKVLNSVVSSGKGSDSYRATVKGLLAAVPKQPNVSSGNNEDLLRLPALSNRDLKYKVWDQVGQIRSIVHQSHLAMQTSTSAEARETSYRIERDSWQPMHEQCLAMRDEMVIRLRPASLPELTSTQRESIEPALTEGRVGGINALTETASYLERLANALPPTNGKKASR